MILTNKLNRKDQGFTIVELLVVIVVIGILAAITIVSYTGVSNQAKTAKAQQNASSAATIADLYNNSKGYYPDTLALFNAYSADAKWPSGVSAIAGLPGANAATFTGTDPLTSTNGDTRITYACFITCTNSTGGRITYFDYQAGNSTQSAKTLFVGAASSTAVGAFVAIP
ncbi:prepilin-type N-terminal cleavage/methylation domain-containing protein [Candidatus Saccharibacteria bacterium]|nr:prepilin-type N-terminal cleavage/methylation domain-containing protein [Candidatus Saccharibacteria bacterium]